MTFEKINENRNLYDLCRKYKYYYTAYQKMKELEHCYWSKYIQEAYKEVKTKLDETAMDIAMTIFISTDLIKTFDVTSIPTTEYSRFFGKVYLQPTKSETVIYGEPFAKLIIDLMHRHNLQMDYIIEK